MAECMPNVWWGCGKDDYLRAFLAKLEAAYAAEAMADGSALNIVQICTGRRMLAANKGQNRFGEVVGPFLSFFKDFSDYNDLRFVCKRMRLDKLFKSDPTSDSVKKIIKVY